MKSIAPFFLIFILFSCKLTKQHKTYCGKVIWENAAFNPNTNLFVSISFSYQFILFKDSAFIDQIVMSTWDSTGVLYAYNHMYKYIDLPKQQCAMYSNISDTAKCNDILS